MSCNVHYMFIPVSTVQYMFLSVSTVLCGASVPQCYPTSGALPRILSTGQEGENSDNQLLSSVTNIHLSTSLRFTAVLITLLTLSSLLKSNLMYALPTNCYWLWCTWNFPISCRDERSAFTYRMFTLNRKSEKSDFEFFNNTVFISTHCEQ